jgi:hypothetical protein
MHMIVGIGILVALALFLLGWLVPLVIGIRRSSRHSGGTALIIVGGVWGAAALGLIALGAVAFIGFSRATQRAEPKAFDTAAHAGAKGFLRTACTGATTLTVQDEAGGSTLRLESTNGILAAPAGTLRLQRFTTTATGADGATWTIAGYNFGRDVQTLTVPADGTADVALGPPYRAVVTPSKAGDGQQAFDLKITGVDGSRVSLYVQAVRRKPLQFEVLDAAGRSVWSGNFEYG